MLLAEKAEVFAKYHHNVINDQRYGDALYSHHLSTVVYFVRIISANCGLPIDKDVHIAAAWLHDVVEDCDVSLETIDQLFGSHVARLVWALTDPKGCTRKEKLPLLFDRLKEVPEALIIKFADRHANIVNQGKKDMYSKEFEPFVDALCAGFPEIAHRLRGYLYDWVILCNDPDAASKYLAKRLSEVAVVDEATLATADALNALLDKVTFLVRSLKAAKTTPHIRHQLHDSMKDLYEAIGGI